MNMIATAQASSAPAAHFQPVLEKAEKAIASIDQLFEQGMTVQVACSFGKDSSVVLVLALESLKRRIEAGKPCSPLYITHSNTGIENPAMDVYSSAMIGQLEQFAGRHGLPIEIVIVRPSLTASFQYGTLGRGKLPVFVGANRACSVDWKITPQRKAAKELLKRFQHPGELVTLVGTRFSESASREAAMRERGDDAGQVTVSAEDNSLTQPVIADWEVDEVWSLLMACDKSRGGSIQTFVENFDWCLSLYRDANEGMCAVITGDGGNRSACNSRFGCVFCTVNGEKDRSMEAMIDGDPEKYGYLKGLNAFRQYLISTRRDLSRRQWLGRKLSSAGYLKVTPSMYSYEMRRDLLRFLLTLDIEEEERAAEHEARLFRGEIPDTEDNRVLCGPMFQLVTAKQLVSIDFAWSLDYGPKTAFPALVEWYEIRTLGKRYSVPEIAPIARIDVPAVRWFNTKDRGVHAPIDGLVDQFLEGLNKTRNPQRPAVRIVRDRRDGSVRKLVYHEESNEMSIDSADALLFVESADDGFYELAKSLLPGDSAKFYLDRSLVRLAKGRAADSDEALRNAQYWRRLQNLLGWETDLREYVQQRTISDDEHKALLEEQEKQAASRTNEAGTLDMFA